MSFDGFKDLKLLEIRYHPDAKARASEIADRLTGLDTVFREDNTIPLDKMVALDAHFDDGDVLRDIDLEQFASEK